MSKRIPLSALENHIRNKLPTQLQKDMREFRIIREGDIACCVYYHLRRFLRSDGTWRIFAERHSKVTGHRVDIVIFREHSRRRQSPRIALELKWNWNRISKKDRASLNKCIQLWGLEKVYFISLYTKKDKQTIQKTEDEKYRLFEIFVHIDLQGQAYEDWRTKRKLFIKMSLGKRLRPRE
jgi:hypothetical protein